MEHHVTSTPLCNGLCEVTERQQIMASFKAINIINSHGEKSHPSNKESQRLKCRDHLSTSDLYQLAEFAGKERENEHE